VKKKQFSLGCPQAQTEHANNQAKYSDVLERQRYAAQLSAKRDARAVELQRQEEVMLRQEEVKRRTLQYEAELRSGTESKRAKVEACAKAHSERENHDLTLSRMRAEMRERRETILQSISVGFSSAGGGMKVFLENQQQMGNAIVLVSSLAVGIYGARSGARVLGNFIASKLSKPSLVRETSRTSLLAWMRPVTWAWKLGTPMPALGALDGVVLRARLHTRLKHIAKAVKRTKTNSAPFRHILLHGPPGTGKTMFAKQLAAHSGLDYAILTGGDIAPLGRSAVTEIHNLFDWATYSRKGLLLFVDEADAFLQSRASEAISEDVRNAFNAFLYRTGEPSLDFVLVYASNSAQDFDWAINDRIDEIIEFSIPAADERKQMLKQYIEKYLTVHRSNPKNITFDGNIDDIVETSVAATEGFSGREIHKLVVAWQVAALDCRVLTLDVIHEVLHGQVAQREIKNAWNSKNGK